MISGHGGAEGKLVNGSSDSLTRPVADSYTQLYKCYGRVMSVTVTFK